MHYRKLKASYLFTGEKLLNSEKVLLVDEKGRIHKLINEEEAGRDVEIYEGILSPGFINAQCHLELSHLKNVFPEKTGLVDFVFKVVTERHFNEDDIEKAMEIGEEEMIKNAIVAVGDISNNLISIKQKQKKNLCYYNFIETSEIGRASCRERV